MNDFLGFGKSPCGHIPHKHNACFSEKCFFEWTKNQTPFLPRDYCGVPFPLILIHRKALETLCLVTGLAQWAGTRIRSGSRIRRVPGSIPGATESDFVSYFLGDVWIFSDIFGRRFQKIAEQINILKKWVIARLLRRKPNFILNSFILTRRGGAI